MSQITINTINGTPPYSIYVCSTFLLNCILTSSGVTSTPITIDIPSAYTYSPSVLIKIVDSQSCEYTQVYSCISPTPTPSFTVTPTYTPSNTSTQPVTPSNTQTSYTPTPTPTTTITPTITSTPTSTPQVAYNNVFTILVIEPMSASTSIGNYMQSQGVNFFGFSNGVAPSTNQVDYENEMNVYLKYPGWKNGELPGFITLNYPSYDFPVQPTVDLFGNPITRFNFTTQLISANTITGKAWYTFFISTGYTNGVFQKSIDLSTESKNVFSEVGTNSTYYNLNFDLKIGYVYNLNIRMYTTFPSIEFLLDNTQNIYFKGSVIGP